MFPKSLEKAIKKYDKMNKKFKKFDLKVTKVNLHSPNPQVHGFKDIESAYEASEALERYYGSMSIVGTPEDGSTPIEFLDHLPTDPREKGHPQHWDYVRGNFGSDGHMRHIPPDLLLYLSQYDTGQWENEEIDFVFSGKDADLQTSNHGVWLHGYVVEEGQWYLQCGVCFQASLSRPEGSSSPSINEFNEMKMLDDNLNLTVSEEEWYAHGEEAFLVPLDKPEVMAQSIHDEAMKIMKPVHDQLDAARKFLDELDADDSDNDDDDDNNNSNEKN